jgi:hypothetical protein
VSPVIKAITPYPVIQYVSFVTRYHVPPVLFQYEDKSFCGYFSEQNDVLKWLLNDCVWKFSLSTNINQRDILYPTSILCFSISKAAIEFKLRWINV